MDKFLDKVNICEEKEKENQMFERSSINHSLQLCSNVCNEIYDNIYSKFSHDFEGTSRDIRNQNIMILGTRKQFSGWLSLYGDSSRLIR